MYTQCPECEIAFRVTAKVLQQAGGNVRCGSCGHAFNALEFLSEDMPAQGAADGGGVDAEEPVDDLAETSRRLLETLDELAGPEQVRIEDTGVEWRVLDDAAAADVSLAPEQLESEEERRYDDNSPLPDELDDDTAYPPPAAPRRREDDQGKKTDEFVERQGDLALSEPEDWTDILEEVRDPSIESLEVEEELVAIHNELSAIDDELTDEVPLIDEGGLAAEDDDAPDAVEVDLIDQIEAGAASELAAFDNDDDEGEEDADVDTGDDEDTGVFESVLEAGDDLDQDAGDDSDEDIEDEDIEYEDIEYEDIDDANSIDADIDDEDAVAEGAEILSFDRESTGEFDAQIEEAAIAFAAGETGENFDDHVDEEVDEEEVADDETDVEDGIEVDAGDDTGPDEIGVVAGPDPAYASELDEHEDELVDADAEEEQAEADEKFDFAATMVGLENAEELFDESSGEVETIIMEGDFIRSEVEKDRIAAGHSARSELDDPASLLDTYALNRGKVRGGRRSYDPPSIVVVGAIAGLTLILIGQLMHNSRQSLATYGFFNSTIAPVYRMLGSPITPDWDVNGWQFEATNGNVDEEETTLTIVSRIGNRSAQALPYPLVHVELTDRFDDVRGSAILEPVEYLASDGDPSLPIEPGENFTSVITIDDPSVEVSGYRLKVCYRIEPGTVHCAEESFRN